jgi:phosphoglycerate kinase
MRWNGFHIPKGIIVIFKEKKVLENMKIGNSLFDEKGSHLVNQLVAKAKAKNVTIYLPTDFVTADKFTKDANTGLCTKDEGIPEGW